MWELDHKEGWALKNWCFWTLVLENTLEGPLDSKEISLVIPKGNQSWIFIGRTYAKAEAPVLWALDAKSQLTGKVINAGKDWEQEEKGITADEMVVTPWTVAHQAPLSMGFAWRECWYGLPCTPPWDPPYTGKISQCLLHLLNCRQILYHGTTWEALVSP